MQQQTLGHRGRKRDDLYKIRKLLVRATEKLDGRGVERVLGALHIGDPDHEVLAAWAIKEAVRDIYLTDHYLGARDIVDTTITACHNDPVPEIQTLGRTLKRWRDEILHHHLTGASNGPTEALNLLIKRSNAQATVSPTSTTTGSESSYTPAASTRNTSHHEPLTHTQTRRAVNAAISRMLRRLCRWHDIQGQCQYV